MWCMSKRISISFWLFCLLMFGFRKTTTAQTPTFRITLNSINAKADTSITDNSVKMPSCLLAMISEGVAVTTTDFTPALSNVLATITAQVTGVGGITVISSQGAVQLTPNTTKTVYSGTLSLGTSSVASMKYTLPGSTISSQGWKAGTYVTPLAYATQATGVSCSTPSTIVNLTISVDPFITFPTASGITLTVDKLDYFRNTTVSNTVTLNNIYTVPLGIHVKSTSPTFTYGNGYTGATDPNTSTSYVSAAITTPTGGSPISLGTGYQNLSPSGGYAIPPGNTQNSTITYSISPADLKNHFVQKGSYATTLNYEAFNASAPTQNVSGTSAPLTVNVADMSELVANVPNITLSFKNASDYVNGVDTTIQGNLRLSSTVNCSVTVAANTSALASGSNSIPLDCVSIGLNGSSQTVSLSTTPQAIVSGIMPVIDKPLDITYSIPKNKVSEILGKPTGTYTAQLVYTLTAP